MAGERVLDVTRAIDLLTTQFADRIDPARIAVNYSEGSEICDGLTHGMYLTLQRLLGELGMADRLVSAEPVVSALRERKSAGELHSMR